MEAFPPLPSSTMPETTSVTPKTLPDGLVCLNGKVYQLVPAPHNVVAATSNIPAPTMIPCTLVSGPTTSVVTPTASSSTVSTVASSFCGTSRHTGCHSHSGPSRRTDYNSLGYVSRTSKNRSRVCHAGNTAEKSKSLPIPIKFSTKREEGSHQEPCLSPSNEKSRPTGRGRGKKRPEMTNAPILVPTTHSHLINNAKPKPGLTVALSEKTTVPQSVHHLSQLTTEASVPLQVTTPCEPSTNTVVTIEPQPLNDNSDVDLETGEAVMPLRDSCGPQQICV